MESSPGDRVDYSSNESFQGQWKQKIGMVNGKCKTFKTAEMCFSLQAQDILTSSILGDWDFKVF